MKLVFTLSAWKDYVYWQDVDSAILARVNEVIRDCLRSPFVGIGKPEPLHGNMKGCWSRRITREHRLVYQVSGSGEAQIIEILSCRYHYER